MNLHYAMSFRNWFVRIGKLIVALILNGLCTTTLRADAVSSGEIVLGMSTVLSGPAASLGLNMRQGVLASLNEQNRAGGIRGRMIRLVSFDDGYEPARSIPNVRRLVDVEKVLAIVGDVGTPTAIASFPIAEEGHTLFYGAFSGAGALRRTPPDRYVVNYRASYAEETATIVDALIEQAKLQPEQVAFLTQRDRYGDSGFAGGIMALKRHRLRDESAIAHVRYERNTMQVERALADLLLLDPTPRAVIMVGAYAPCSKFIRLARQNGLNARFINVSFVGSEALATALGADGDGVMISQVVPHYDSDLPVVREYRSAIKAFAPDSRPTFGSLEGYISTRILLRALETARGGPERDSLVDALEALGRFDIGLGETLELGTNHHQACHHIWPTVIRGGRVEPTTWQAQFKPVEVNHD